MAGVRANLPIEDDAGSILIVDDVAEVRDLCVELVSQMGLHAVAADSPLAAKTLLERQPFSIVISDIAMPGMDGLQLTRHIRTHYPHTDVILMTAFSMRYSYDDVLEAGAIDFIQKPFSKEEFEAKIKRVLRERCQFNAIQQSEQRFRTLLANIPGVVFSLYPDGTIRFVDNKIKDLTGYSADALTQSPELLDTIFATDGGSFVTGILTHPYQEKGSLVREYRIKGRTGHPRWLQIRCQAVMGADDSLDHVSGIVLDVTHERDLEEKTRALNQLLVSLGTDHEVNKRAIVQGSIGLMRASAGLLYLDAPADKGGALWLFTAEGDPQQYPPDNHRQGPLLSQLLSAPPHECLVFADLLTTDDLRWDFLVQRHHWRRALGKPLVVSGRKRGAFLIAFDSEGDIAAADRALFATLAKAVEVEEERREMQEALIRSEEKYRTLVEGNLYPIAIIDGQGTIRYSNQVMSNMFGVPAPQGLMGMDFTELFHPDVRQRLLNAISEIHRHAEQALETTMDLPGLGRNGREMEIRLRLGLTSYDGNPAIQAILEDVTERKQTEQALRDSEERYRTLVEGANDAVFLETFDGHIVDVNSKACEMLGYSRTELLRLDMADLISPAVDGNHEGSRLRPHNQHHEETMLGKSGQRIPVEVNTSILRLKGEKYLMSIVRDITTRKQKELEQRQLERAILESKQRLMAVFDGIMAPLTITDLDFNIIMVNKAVANMFGQPIRKLIGRKCYEIFRRTAEPCPGCAVAETIRTGKPSHRVETNPIVHRTIEEYTYPIYDTAGNLSLVINYGYDVTDKIKMQRQLLQADKMASLGTLAAGIAHEIRNPMATINLNTQILLRDLDLDEEHRVYMLDIQKEIKKIERIISEILEFSKPKPANLVQTSINEVVQSVYELTRVQLRKYQVETELLLADPLPPVLVDPAQISQVVINLVINAMQAMPAGGRLTIQTRQQESSGLVELEVRDTGVGIAPENLEKIFDPFFTDKPEGTGLGLSIARQILEKNHATISVDSAVGKGTRFVIQFRPAPETEPQ